jgi:uncharacterized protein
MPASGIKLIDANLWLALAFSDHEHHLKGKSWFDEQRDGACAFCRVTQLALLRHLTNSRIMGKFVLTQEQAWRAFDEFMADPRCLFLDEPQSVESYFRSLTQASTSSLERWTDSYLARFALANGLQLVTFDRGFRRFDTLDLLVLT